MSEKSKNILENFFFECISHFRLSCSIFFNFSCKGLQPDGWALQNIIECLFNVLRSLIWQTKSHAQIICQNLKGRSGGTRSKNLSPCLSDWGKFLEGRSWRWPRLGGTWRREPRLEGQEMRSRCLVLWPLCVLPLPFDAAPSFHLKNTPQIYWTLATSSTIGHLVQFCHRLICWRPFFTSDIFSPWHHISVLY